MNESESGDDIVSNRNPSLSGSDSDPNPSFINGSEFGDDMVSNQTRPLDAANNPYWAG